MKKEEIKIGDHLITTKGDKMTKIRHSGIVIGFSRWGRFDSAVMKRDMDGVKKAYLIKNLIPYKL